MHIGIQFFAIYNFKNNYIQKFKKNILLLCFKFKKIKGLISYFNYFII